ncbi:DUF4320 family protein [Peptoanaerobacter stomatis]
MKKIKIQINNIKYKILKKIKNEDGFIEMFFIIVLFFFLISVLISVAPPFIAREKLSIISQRVVDKVAYDGKVTADTHTFINDLITKANMQDKDVTYSFNGNIRADGKIQLRDEFTFNIDAKENINLTGFGLTSITIPINKSLDGISEVFYKSSEL